MMASTESTTTRTPTSQLFSLQGKTVIATGGTGGLGVEMCVAMAESGANIVSIHLPDDPAQSKLEEAVTAVGGKITAFAADVGDSAALRKTFHDIWQAGIVPDVLLNCAGLNRRGPIEQMTDDKIDLIFSVNLKGSYVAAQEFGMQLIKLKRPGKIINIASFTSFVAMTQVSAYAATKGGVVQMTRAFSNEWAQHGIQVGYLLFACMNIYTSSARTSKASEQSTDEDKVNCICPGYFKTPLSAQLLQDYPEMEEYIANRTPAARWGNPADLRGAVLFLSSPASDFVTGTSVVVDGGMMFR